MEATSTPSGNNTYSQQGTALNNGGGDKCNGFASVATLNDMDAATTYHHNFAWSDCSPPESCNTNVRENLCVGTYTVTVTDDLTGCSHTYDFNIADYQIYLNESSSINGYLPSDFNLDKHTSTTDFNLILNNSGAIGIDWIRYE